MPIRVDFSQAMDALPAGVYELRLQKWEEKPSKSSDFPYLRWTFKVVGGEFDGKTISNITTLNPAGAFKLKEQLRAFGEQLDPFAKVVEVDPDKYVNQSCWALLSVGEYEGRPNNNFERIMTQAEAREVQSASTSNGGGAGRSRARSED